MVGGEAVGDRPDGAGGRQAENAAHAGAWHVQFRLGALAQAPSADEAEAVVLAVKAVLGSTGMSATLSASALSAASGLASGLASASVKPWRFSGRWWVQRDGQGYV